MVLGTFVYGMKIDVAGIVIWTVLFAGVALWAIRFHRKTIVLDRPRRIAELERELGINQEPPY